jgi:hypothetical protein
MRTGRRIPRPSPPARKRRRPDEPWQEHVPGVPGMALDLQTSIGNRAVTRLLPALPLARAPRLQRKQGDDSGFNVALIVDELRVAIDQEDVRLNEDQHPIRKVDYAKTVAALDNLTLSQAEATAAAYGKSLNHPLEYDLFGDSRVPTSLTVDQRIHIRTLLRGSVPEPREFDPATGELMPWTTGNLRTHADADAAHLRVLLGEANKPGPREELMLMLRQPEARLNALAQAYHSQFNT